MCARRDLRIIRVSTDGETPERVAERVLSLIEGAGAGREANGEGTNGRRADARVEIGQARGAI
jgi:hypothetical protein